MKDGAIIEKDNTLFPQLIFQTWKNYDLPEKFEYWSNTWKLNHPGYEYKLWSDEDNRNFVKETFPKYLQMYDSYNENIKRVDAVRIFFISLWWYICGFRF